MTGYQAKILVEPGAPPKYCKSRSVPYFYLEKVNKELDKLVEEGTLEPNSSLTKQDLVCQIAHSTVDRELAYGVSTLIFFWLARLYAENHVLF